MKKIILSSLVLLIVACKKDVTIEYTINFQDPYKSNCGRMGHKTFTGQRNLQIPYH
jgi:hypothetical protein